MIPSKKRHLLPEGGLPKNATRKNLKKKYMKNLVQGEAQLKNHIEKNLKKRNQHQEKGLKVRLTKRTLSPRKKTTKLNQQAVLSLRQRNDHQELILVMKVKVQDNSLDQKRRKRMQILITILTKIMNL